MKGTPNTRPASPRHRDVRFREPQQESIAAAVGFRPGEVSAEVAAPPHNGHLHQFGAVNELQPVMLKN